MSAGTALINPQEIFSKIGLASGMRVADLGCGRTGHFIFTAARVVGGTGMIYAIDVQREVLDTIQSRIRVEGFDNIQTVWSDLTAVGRAAIPPATLDGAFIVNVVWLLKERTQFIQEGLRLLKPGAFLVVIDWARTLGPGVPAQLVSPDEIIEIGKRNGLFLVERLSVGNYHYGLYFKKA
jgi:ubiquinone/menaquinone biosynthesis C-methylase UbiE